MKVKGWIIATTAAMVLSATSIMVMAKPDPIKVMLNGTEWVTEAAPVHIDDEIMVPLQTFGKLFGKQVTYDSQSNTVRIDDKKQVPFAQSDDQTIQISGDASESGTYENLTLKTQTFSRHIPGYNVDNPSYAPIIDRADLTGDGKKDIVIILTTGYGTGVYTSNPLVYAETADPIPVEDAYTAFLKQFDSKVTDKQIELDIRGERTVIPISKLQSGPVKYPPGIGSVMTYTLEGNTLKATTAVQVSPAEFIGDLTLSYTFKNGLLQAGDAQFALYPEYGS
ncbi:stalk domain-containing protein [Paenibacillus favisporus]|uniref:stalk domain-containing protein n=1 Tax=Paenibacillus favisporus TaxID=221028 RepID=UPI0013D13C50|nr:stalk domain-containing protein [Paenibacillus favisporus]